MVATHLNGYSETPMAQQHTLYAAPLSLYSGKARAYLQYKNIPYTEELSSLKVYKKIIIPQTGVRFIPVVGTPQGEYLQDTTHIIDTLEPRFPDKSVYPTTPKQHLVSLMLELYGDEWLLIPAMHYRWNFDNFPFIYEEFGSTVFPKLPRFMQRFIGKQAGSKFRGFVPLLGITDNNRGAIETWYEQRFLPALNTHLEQHDFLLGSAPSIADYGFMGPLYAHLYRDPYPGRVMQRIAPNVARWVERMNDAAQITGTFLPDDQIPDTLLPILAMQLKEQWPVLQETVQRVHAWHQENPEETQVPRMLGKLRFSIEGVEEERAVVTYSQWMLQRVLDFYRSLDGDAKTDVDTWLKSIDAFDAMQLDIPTRVARENNKLVVAAT
jgi:glutathione S-transferase